jgi:hypothetical protein
MFQGNQFLIQREKNSEVGSRFNDEDEIELQMSTMLKFEYYGYPAMSTRFKYRYIEMITVLGKVVDMSDICNFYRRCILPIRWSYHRFLMAQKT